MTDKYTARKTYPANFPEDVTRVLDAMTMSGGRLSLAGSAALRSMLYSADYDGFQKLDLKKGSVHEAAAQFAKELQGVVRRLRDIPKCFIADIKCGVVEDWKVVPDSARVVRNQVVGYDANAIREKIDTLMTRGLLSAAEGRKALALAKDVIRPVQLLELRDAVRPHIIRWQAGEVIKGQKRLADGSTITLSQAILTPGLCKVDAVAWVAGNHFADFSVIYQFFNHGEALNPVTTNMQQDIEEDILNLTSQDKWFKALKRHYSLAKLQGNVPVMQRLLPILNGDLGRIYSLMSDVGTLIYLLENKKGVSMRDVKFEIDQFRARLANIYETPGFGAVEKSVLARIRSALDAHGAPAILKALNSIEGELGQILARSSPK